MKYIDEYRDKEQVQSLVRAIRQVVTRPWHIMEICGGQTHAIARYRLEEMLPEEVKLLHGPGCPVCVTPVGIIDRAIGLAKRPDVILASFGDMMRVPGSREDLLQVKANGADIRMLYSPLDAVSLAAGHPDKKVIFFAIGFETTAPVHMMALKEAVRRKLENFYLLTSLFTVPPAIEAILSDPESRVDGFLTAGHVCAITGNEAYHLLAKKYKTPMVVTGFEPADLLLGIYRCLLQLEAGIYKVENAYKRAVPEEGNPAARALMDETLELCDQEWRGIGVIPQSGLQLKEIFARQDALHLLPVPEAVSNAEDESAYQVRPDKKPSSMGRGRCIAGDIMRGTKQTKDCPFFGTLCTPDHPVGAPMVSSEGVCAAYYRYK